MPLYLLFKLLVGALVAVGGFAILQSDIGIFGSLGVYTDNLKHTIDLTFATMNGASQASAGMFDNGVAGLIKDAERTLGLDFGDVWRKVDKSPLGDIVDGVEDFAEQDLLPEN